MSQITTNGGVQVARLVGGAGTGKTTELLNLLSAAREKLGGDPFAVGFTSFTRAARAEAVARASAEWDVPPDVLRQEGWFKTVHSIAYGALGIKSGQMVDESKESAQWLAGALGVGVRAVIDEVDGRLKFGGDKPAAAALNAWCLARARMAPLDEVIRKAVRLGAEIPSYDVCRQYIERYEAAKRLDDRVDFSDLLSRFGGVEFTVGGFEIVEPEGFVPAQVQAWVMDEQQDASALVDVCCKRLAYGGNAKWVYLGGDPMQSIFGFGGSDSRLFMSWKVDKERIMPKTWRCPPRIHKLGEDCLKRMRAGYWDRGIAPADHDGTVTRGGYAESVVSSIDPTEDTLIIARCKFTVDEWGGLLKDRKIPYCQLKDNDAPKFRRAVRALWAIEHGEPCSAEDFALAIERLPATGNMTRGAKAMWGRSETIRDWEVVYPEHLEKAGLKPEFAAKIKAGDWGKLFRNAERWREAATKYGPDLATEPRVRIGTIHAAKGMQASTVILSTSRSRRIAESEGIDHDVYNEERRVEYVGVTRAIKKLIVATERNGDHHMRLPI